MQYISKLSLSSSYLPEKILTNEEISNRLETSDDWITTRTGIRQRHIARDDEHTSDMSVVAVRRLIESGNLSEKDIDILIVATTTPDLAFPSVACMVQSKVGLVNAACFDISAACSGFVYALHIADSFIKSGSAKKIIVVGADKMSSIVDWNDRSTCILFGDGAGAVLLEAVENVEAEKSRIISSKIYSDGSLGELLCTTGGISKDYGSCSVTMNGREVFKNAVNKMSESSKSIIAENGFSIKDVDFVIPHQANIRIIDSVMSHLGLPAEKAISTIDRHGNTSAASIPLALDVALKEGRVKKGDLVIMQAVGGGLTWGCALLRL